MDILFMVNTLRNSRNSRNIFTDLKCDHNKTCKCHVLKFTLDLKLMNFKEIDTFPENGLMTTLELALI
jgi:hypothetical protein